MSVNSTYFNNCSEFEMRAAYCTARFMYGYQGKFEEFDDAMKNAKEPVNPANVKQISAKESAQKIAMGTSESLVRLAERGAELGLWDDNFYQQRINRLKQRSQRNSHLSEEERSANQNVQLSQFLIENRRRAAATMYEQNMF
ncbi:hypothetical protein [Aneurinibacillus aneurinilyticus]|uniref:Uncharacterized protein n=2 Tax=Bacteria TaxID=2 RepID=U1X9I3_ANEAE|nr:hypothetical protein [Aneurinibacillus aneurinilyticus]ERI11198.1 hypothetical protein HMPREF0083_00703 [Aneurinibacillus aneurinilyticus ATCC 12856]MED0709357.1 hypothetical protein [Aneurinibacillus aneurinilyticus]MED0726427.1 hypothetical protein [Aneurinibacillus aneurinilyticus]MED0735393.1 hypothetical protein [Aneurinibacillus aneurinilyticus]MED0742153.1 hypothetical protein [Aneurinibacillus aneurinilyticus]